MILSGRSLVLHSFAMPINKRVAPGGNIAALLERIFYRAGDAGISRLSRSEE